MISLFEQAPCRQSNLGLLDLELVLVMLPYRTKRGESERSKKSDLRDSQENRQERVV